MPVRDKMREYAFDDDKRSALPYVDGGCFQIKLHMPLAPFDSGKCYEFPEVSDFSDPVLPSEYLFPSEILKPSHHFTPWSWSPSEDTNSSRITLETITERYLRHQHRKTKPYEKDGTARCLKIVRQIRVRDGAYAQVVECRVDNIEGPLVAMIFDTLYRSDDVWLDTPRSPVGLAEFQWSREAAAYARIQECDLDGRYTPRFKGCWPFDLPYELELELAGNSVADHDNTATTTGGDHQREASTQRRGSSNEFAPGTIRVTRNVRLLLMEFIPGKSILNLLETGDYQKIPSNVRMDLLECVGEAHSALWHILVSQGDLHSRNVVVVEGKNPPAHLLSPEKWRTGNPKLEKHARTTRTRRSGVARRASRLWQIRRSGPPQCQTQPQR